MTPKLNYMNKLFTIIDQNILGKFTKYLEKMYKIF